MPLFMFVVSNTAFAAEAASEEPSAFLLFLGRFHPLFVHLPIGFLIIAFLLECFSRLQRFHEVRHATSLVLLLGTISAVAAALLGYFLSFEGGYDEDALFWHQWFGIGVAVTAAIAYYLKIRSEGKVNMARKAYIPALSVSMVSLMAAGHLGGNLTHGSEYLTQYMPGPLRTLAGLPVQTKTVAKPITNIQEAVLYTDIVHPIFEERCISCHNPEKKKGDLLMHNFADLMKGGEDGKVLVAGKSAESSLYKHITLPLEHDDHMPPKGKKQLTKAQIELIRWWIDEGASPDKKVAQAKIDEPVKEALAKMGVSSEDEGKPTGIFAKQVAPANAASIATLKKAGFMVMSISQDNHYLQVKFTAAENTFGAEQIKNLLTVAQQVAWLDLSDAKLTPEGLKDLSKLPNLTRLRMDKTNITDEYLAHLKGLPNLEYLNLYNTQVSDKGLAQLASLKNLKTLYLWQTQVSPEGVQNLQKQIPGLVANTGWVEKDTISTAQKNSQVKVVSQKK
ncbi:ribonuclease inhibitor [Rhodocytophaga rosea]|uniref:Ribonuclease inhibitor n=1 Tax=Rhodocytophaga rosea TaxID=2704465 RepID=A0A6C0GDE5_9BACT|nr:c-type cytochrome domain-containing protein [Rhodocytophaga rosea]QHT65995.1 ribonuclease inhibitor [Rhodocytophaga rosea]